MKNQPALDLPKTTLEVWLDVASWLFVTLALALAIGYYPDLPERIPTHFNASGTPDGYGTKYTIFLLPVFSCIMVAGMVLLARFPHQFNYLTVITPENAAFEYRKARTTIRVMNVLVSLLFLLITWHIVRAAAGEGSATLGLWFGILVAATIITPLALLFGWRDKKGR